MEFSQNASLVACVQYYIRRVVQIIPAQARRRPGVLPRDGEVARDTGSGPGINSDKLGNITFRTSPQNRISQFFVEKYVFQEENIPRRSTCLICRCFTVLGDSNPRKPGPPAPLAVARVVPHSLGVTRGRAPSPRDKKTFSCFGTAQTLLFSRFRRSQHQKNCY